MTTTWRIIIIFYLLKKQEHKKEAEHNNKNARDEQSEIHFCRVRCKGEKLRVITVWRNEKWDFSVRRAREKNKKKN